MLQTSETLASHFRHVLRLKSGEGEGGGEGKMGGSTWHLDP